MKAKLIVLALLVFWGTSTQAQNNTLQNWQLNKTPKTGLKGFIEAGWGAGVNIYSDVPVSLLTTIGYQINHHLFVGLGSGEIVFTSQSVYSIPLYADFRYNVLKKAISPFVDTKIGYAISDLEGFYASPSVGVRFGTSINTALTVSIGYELQRADKEKILLYGYKSTEYIGGIIIKFGFDF